MQTEKYIRSVSDSQTEIIKNILKLHVPGGKIDCDATFSKGLFYKDGDIALPHYRFDIAPKFKDVICSDCRNLPLLDSSINCMILDPPFLATKGKSLASDSGNIINKRFGVYPDEKSLHQFYADSIAEAYRVLNDKGILIFKCQDKVSSGKQYMSHVFIANSAISCGFYPKDLLILTSKSRLTVKWQMKHQKHARKYHCYFWAFQKNGYVIDYT